MTEDEKQSEARAEDIQDLEAPAEVAEDVKGGLPPIHIPNTAYPDCPAKHCRFLTLGG